MLRWVVLSLWLRVFWVGAAGESDQHVRLERLSDRVALAYWVGTDRRCNLTAIRSQKGLVIVDTEASPRIMAPIKQRIEEAFGQTNWIYVINTHAHDSHASGNSLFPGAVIVGHENLTADMQWLIRRQTEPEWKRRELDQAARTLEQMRAVLPRVAANPVSTKLVSGEIAFWELFTQDLEEGYKVVKPSLTFKDTHTLDLGDVTLELVFFGRGHSLSDSLVYIPEERLLITGAIVYQRGQLPEIGEGSDLRDVERFLAVLDRFLAADVRIDRVVPSHSPPLIQSDLRPVRDYYVRMLAGVRSARQEGLTFEQAARRLDQRKSFPGFRVPQRGQWCYGMHERNLRNLWRILEEEPRQPKPGQPRRTNPDEQSAPVPGTNAGFNLREMRLPDHAAGDAAPQRQPAQPAISKGPGFGTAPRL